MSTAVDLAHRLLCGDQLALSRLLTLVERGAPGVDEAMQVLHPHTGRAYCVGVTGTPAAGKSTLVNELTGVLRSQGESVGVLAVDPTSPFSGGAVLGDRIRMQRHFLDRGVFIRSIATRGDPGGLSPVARRMVRLLDAAGKDVVLVETVGVGQTELGVMGIADTVVVVLVPETGDAVHTLKAGLLEIGDIFVINKSDREGADHLGSALETMLNMTQRDDGWRVPVLSTQAHRGLGVEEVWGKVCGHRAVLEGSVYLQDKRREQRRREFLDTLHAWIQQTVLCQIDRSVDLQELVRQVERDDVDPYTAAVQLRTGGDIIKRLVIDPKLNETKE